MPEDMSRPDDKSRRDGAPGPDDKSTPDDKLSTYRRKRDASRTPEPVPAAGPLPQGNDDTFVIQEHHATALHWDFRLERDGVLVSWAIPKGLPEDPKQNRLAVQTEDHPLEYASFADDIPAGEYGGGRVIMWDRGTYTTEKWSDREVMVVLDGQRARGRYVLFRTGGKQWMIHRMDPPPPGWQPMPELVKPMMATAGELPAPAHDHEFAYELKWDGVRAVVYVDGGRVRVMTRNDLDVSAAYPEIRDLGASLGATKIILDGEIVAMDEHGRVSFGALQQRMHVRDAARVRRLVAETPITYVAFDVLYLDGKITTGLPYVERRDLLRGLGISGPRWTTSPAFDGGGADVLAASRDHGLEGIMAKRLDSPYEPGQRSRQWIKVKNTLVQAVVIGGWRPGKGRRERSIGSLLVGIPTADGLTYVGHVGTGFTDRALEHLTAELAQRERADSPFAGKLPTVVSRDAHWTEPELVGEVRFGEWTGDGIMRHPSWRGLRPDVSPTEVVRET
jgi:bifunctional non-homologous end joining protein LigD